MPEAYNTVITSGGTNLSGGQRQRIAIARAFLKDSPIVIMVSHRDSFSFDFAKIINM